MAPEHASFPSLPAPGVVEQGASCVDLDVELARAEAIRWYARDQGGAPFTPSEIAKTHAKNFAKDTGIAVLAFVALAGGGGSGCWSKCGDSSPNVLSTEDWRWAVTAAQRRVIGLLELKQAKHCPLGVVSGMDGGDLGVLEQIAGTRRQHAAGLVDDVVLSAQETSWLDKLNPAPLGPRDQSGRVVEYGEGVVQKFDHVVWELDMNSWMSSGSANTLRGTIVLTEKSLIVQLPSDERTSTGPVVHIPYNDMASVEMQSKMGMHWAVVRRLNGHAAVFWFQHRLSIERKRTEAVAALIKSRIPAKSAAEAGK